LEEFQLNHSKKVQLPEEIILNCEQQLKDAWKSTKKTIEQSISELVKPFTSLDASQIIFPNPLRYSSEHWTKLKAAFRRNGVYDGIDFNDDLTVLLLIHDLTGWISFSKKIKEALVSFGRSIESSFEPVHTEMKYASLLPQIGISISQMRIKNIEEEINLNLESFLVSIQLWHRLAYFAVRKKIQALLSPVYKDLFKKMGKGYVKDSLEDLQKFFHENAVMLCKETEASVFSQLSDSTTLASKRFMLTIGKLSALEFPTIPISHISPPKEYRCNLKELNQKIENLSNFIAVPEEVLLPTQRISGTIRIFSTEIYATPVIRIGTSTDRRPFLDETVISGRGQPICLKVEWEMETNHIKAAMGVFEKVFANCNAPFYGARFYSHTLEPMKEICRHILEFVNEIPGIHPKKPKSSSSPSLSMSSSSSYSEEVRKQLEGILEKFQTTNIPRAVGSSNASYFFVVIYFFLLPIALIEHRAIRRDPLLDWMAKGKVDRDRHKGRLLVVQNNRGLDTS